MTDTSNTVSEIEDNLCLCQSLASLIAAASDAVAQSSTDRHEARAYAVMTVSEHLEGLIEKVRCDLEHVPTVSEGQDHD